MDSSSTVDALKIVTIYTDGGAVPNPGRGGYGVVLRFGAHAKELSGGYRLTTNNRMELMAAIVALEALKQPCHAKLHSDSQYVVDAINNGSAAKWRSSGWRMNASGTKTAKNPDLWERLLVACQRHKVEFIWIKGHAGIEDNERCDRLAHEALNIPDPIDDVGYEAESGDSKPSNTKMTEDGQPCRKCGEPVKRKVPQKKTIKPNQTYYYEWYLQCTSCKTNYMVEEAKREIDA